MVVYPCGTMKMRKCNRCERELPDEAFHRTSYGPPRHICKECVSARSREWYLANAERLKAARKAYYEENAERIRARRRARYANRLLTKL